MYICGYIAGDRSSMNANIRYGNLNASAKTAMALVWGLLLTAGAAQAGPSTEVSLTGSAITTPAVYGLAELQALPAITQTVNYTAAGVPQSRTYTGTSLWGIVNSAGVINNPAVNNDVLNKYVLATATDGYKVVFSMGELHPNFGNRPDLLAYAEIVNGVSGPITTDGFARVTAPGDIRGGRYVSNLTSLDVRSSGSLLASTGGGRSTSFTITGDVLRPGTFDLAALQALPPIKRVASGVSYTGVSFWDLLNTTAGIALTPGVDNDVLGKYVVATGSDGYKTVFSLGELNPNFGNQPDFIAYLSDGVELGSNGFARIIAPNDTQRGRWMSNLIGLEVLSAAPVPEPATWALMALGVAALSLRARRQAGVWRSVGAR